MELCVEGFSALSWMQKAVAVAVGQLWEAARSKWQVFAMPRPEPAAVGRKTQAGCYAVLHAATARATAAGTRWGRFCRSALQRDMPRLSLNK